ncbi:MULTISPECIES: SDR family NAD(P)-dependent oxidoreductase [Kocuria]|jgi:NAD(P)-dependent dehydrogenase (short-subunit alcohol dehydrogenase family)|uniref:3-hydroxyacyl-CoA dehydrogenase n=1 Tax=Kocuria palustris PEL TaxID=1236550 RepID=M2WDR3_9MICC|nr:MULTISPECIES: SDR family NAD(P)-dependent oxidoreductase [Kocuria]MDN5573308.1 SDR family NAD(P)-dependent oxidoreductase [Micrococcales bacterium]ALB03044.1 3-hydroxy-2-methylbutyryl-CoA dehydrogenase [Kocuria palustris]EME36657.1 3-hydroxyacyl-CoA dehydrogenase [Kocuria palustris PEL]KUG56057.1 3-hydroxy-2-methylbutyryl-CoA dehydrogenase [Kocuria palustris]MBM7824163.1 NAD(P)-dependent dehydrogenase (short-subunit alcohol dehydrogenase family) [Kocuria palustris]
MQLKDTVALVTGAASGLGAATAAALVAQGATVYGVDLQPSIDKAEAQDGVHLIAADVTDPEAVQAAVQEAAAAGPLRLAVNCAGIAPGQRILSKKGPHDIGLFQKVVEINLIGTFSVMTAAAAAMAELEPVDDDGQRGLIVSTASVAAFEGQIGQAAYAASKGGVHALTISAARDLASKGIRVCTIAPGIVETPMMAGIDPDFRAGLEATVPFPARLARPEEYARLVSMLVEHDYLNGETVRMDGALRMPPR